MKTGQSFFHKKFSLRGECKGSVSSVGRFRALMEDGTMRWVLVQDCVGSRHDPRTKRKHAQKEAHSLAQAAWVTGLHPDEICHRAAMNGLELSEAIAALME